MFTSTPDWTILIGVETFQKSFYSIISLHKFPLVEKWFQSYGFYNFKQRTMERMKQARFVHHYNKKTKKKTFGHLLWMTSNLMIQTQCKMLTKTLSCLQLKISFITDFSLVYSGNFLQFVSVYAPPPALEVPSSLLSRGREEGGVGVWGGGRAVRGSGTNYTQGVIVY